MATREGIARVTPGKTFCFLVAPGEPDVFCHQSCYPQGGLQNGDAVSFEWEQKDLGPAVKDGTKVTVLSRGNPVPGRSAPAVTPQQQPAAPARTPAANRNQPDVRVELLFGTHEVQDHSFKMVTRVNIKVDGKEDFTGATVTLMANGMFQGPSEIALVQDGWAEFWVNFENLDTDPPLTVSTIAFSATVFFRNQQYSRTFIWPPQTVSAPPPPPPPPPNLAAADKVDAVKIDQTAAGKFMVAVTTFAKGVKAPGKVSFVAAHGFEVSEFSGAVLVAGNSVSFETESSGEKIVLVDFTGTQKLNLKYKLENGKGTYQDLVLEKPAPTTTASAAASTPVSAPQEPDDLKVEVAAFPNASGMFLVTVQTLNTKKPVQGEFTLVSADALTVTEADGTLIQTGSLVSMKTQANGMKEFFFGYPGSGQILVTFKLGNGFKVPKNVTKKKLK